jgi:hypothetical protein
VRLAGASSQGQVGPSRAVAATTSTVTKEGTGCGSSCRFAANNSETSRGRGRNGLDRLASQELRQISINLALSCEASHARRSDLDRSNVQRPEIASHGQARGSQ